MKNNNVCRLGSPKGVKKRADAWMGKQKKNDEKECKWKDDFGYSHEINKLF